MKPFLDPNIPALSIRQPWAILIARGIKDIENRDWYTQYRGRFYIHAPQTVERDMLQECAEKYGINADAIHTGGLVGKARIVDCVTHHTSGWFYGRYGFVITDAVEFDQPILCKGRLGFFKVDSRTGHEISPH